jgi:Na+-translocating ferredoxin:NAD+ oxidoreductase RnfG subunit
VRGVGDLKCGSRIVERKVKEYSEAQVKMGNEGHYTVKKEGGKESRRISGIREGNEE